MAEVNRNIDIAKGAVSAPESANTIAPSILSRQNMIAKALAAVLAVSSVSCTVDESFEEPSLSKGVGSKETQTKVPKLAAEPYSEELRNYSLNLEAYEDLTLTVKGVSLDDPTNTFETTIDLNIDESIGKGLSSEWGEFQRPTSKFEMKAYDEDGKEMPINFSGEKGTIQGESIVDVEKGFGIEVE